MESRDVDSFSSQPINGLHLQEVGRLRGHPWQISYVRFSPNTARLVTVSTLQSRERFLYEVIGFWDISQGKLFSLVEEQIKTGRVFDVAFAPDGRVVATACENGTVRLRNTDGAFVGALPGHEGGATDLAFSSDGSLLFSSDAAGWLRLWDVATQELLFSFQVAIERDLKQAHGNGDWSKELPLIRDLALSPNGKDLAVVYPAQDGWIHIWQVNATGQAMKWVTAFIDRNSLATRTIFSPDGLLLACIVHEAGMYDVCFYETGSFGFLERLRFPSTWGFSSEIADIAFSPDGRYVAIADIDGVLGIWDVSNHRALSSCVAHPSTSDREVLFSSISSIDWSQVGDMIATAGWEPSSDSEPPQQGKEDFVVKLWKLQE